MRVPLLDSWLDCDGLRVPALYLVGGTVRDILLGRQIKDIDMVCRGAKVFASSLARCRNAALVPMEKKPDEPCYRVVDRSDSSKYVDIAELRGQTIGDDLGQRDFTINAIAVEVKKDRSTGEKIDPFNGSGDLAERTIRMVSGRSLVTDPLRILRAVRLAAVLDFRIDNASLAAIRAAAPLLTGVSSERVLAELMMILRNPRSVSYFRQMDELGILDVIFPETIPMKGCRQNGFHHLDVWEHSLLAMENTECIVNDLSGYFPGYDDRIAALLSEHNCLPMLKLSALLHDTGKPATRTVDPGSGRTVFLRHDREGAYLNEQLSGRLKMSVRDRGLVILMTAEHIHALALVSDDRDMAGKMKWFRKMGDDSVLSIIIAMADIMSSRGLDSTEEYRQQFVDRAKQTVIEYYLRVRPLLRQPSLVTGDDLIALGADPGPGVGRILERVRNAQDTGEVSSRKDALEFARRLLNT